MKDILVLFKRQNNKSLFSIDIAIAITNSSASILVPARTNQDIAYGKDGKHGRVLGLANSKNIDGFPRSLPIKKNRALLGAIIVGGAIRDENDQYANAALLAVNEHV